MLVRKHYIFKGRVQGVGFRFQAIRIAQTLGLAGYVRNLSDGTVEMEAQGEERTVDDLVIRLNREPFIEIEDVDITRIPVKENEKNFRW